MCESVVDCSWSVGSIKRTPQQNETTNKHCTKTGYQITSYWDDENTQIKKTKERSNLYNNHLFRLKTRKKNEHMCDFRPKLA
jgi:hypothetical protein